MWFAICCNFYHILLKCFKSLVCNLLQFYGCNLLQLWLVFCNLLQFSDSIRERRSFIWIAFFFCLLFFAICCNFVLRKYLWWCSLKVSCLQFVAILYWGDTWWYSPKGSYHLQFVAILAFFLQFVAILALSRLCMLLAIWELAIIISSGKDSFTDLQTRQIIK